ncbi:hypothetical protein MRX96_043189 [Rhipicephalus microplus]
MLRERQARPAAASPWCESRANPRGVPAWARGQGRQRLAPAASTVGEHRGPLSRYAFFLAGMPLFAPTTHGFDPLSSLFGPPMLLNAEAY